jgi:serralysin
MAIISISNVVPSVDLAAGDSLNVENTGGVISGFGSSIVAAGSNSIGIGGIVKSNGTAIDFKGNSSVSVGFGAVVSVVSDQADPGGYALRYTGSLSETVSITNYGTITAQYGAGVILAGSNSSLTNIGYIIADQAVFINNSGGESSSFFNSGQIFGSTGNATDGAVVTVAGQTKIENTGTIRGDYAGISLWGIFDGSPDYPISTILNSGIIISGFGAGINLHSLSAMVSGTLEIGGIASLVNTGTITGTGPDGSYIGSLARDIVTNSGTMNGAMSFDEGNDVYDGRGGTFNGTIDGGGGNDLFIFTSLPDKVIEGVNGGHDTVRSTLSIVLDTNVEDLLLFGTGAVAGSGNASNNSLIGNVAANKLSGGAGNDSLAGARGNDTLSGGAGKDFFVFNSAPNAKANRDIITDFSAKDDTIQLENSVFAQLGSKTGTLTAAAFKNLDLGPVDSSDRILYNDKTGALYYDKDGSGAAGAVQIALIKGAPTLTHFDFVVI